MQGILDAQGLARDLHDGPIQDVFATMLRLANLAGEAPDELKEQLHELSELQSRIIARMRSICRGEPVFATSTIRPSDLLLSIVREACIPLQNEPSVFIGRSLDDAIDGCLLEDLAAVLRESLSNVVRHACARNVDVSIDLDPFDDTVVMCIVDDGRGIDDKAVHGSGLANIRRRAIRHRGSCDFAPNPTGGTRVVWRVPAVERNQYGSTGGPEGSDLLRRVAAV